MAYLVRISYPKLNKKQLGIINELFDGNAKEKFIFKRQDNAIIIQPALFDYLEYDFNINPVIKNKAQFMLLEMNKEKKARKIVNNCKYGSDEYNELVRKIRF